MRSIYLGLSTNQGQRHKNLEKAEELLRQNQVQIVQKSNIYETEPWGLKDQAWFLNQCLEAQTELSPEELIQVIQKIEEQMGRLKQEKWGPRLIDIDILYYNNLVLKTEELKIPHPHLKERNFVLTPLTEIASDFIDPVDKQSIQVLQFNCPDDSQVKLYD